MLEPPARDQHAGVDQGFDYCLVGVALLALFGDDTLAGESWRLLRETAIGIDGVGDRRVDAAFSQLTTKVSPDVEVFAAMTWCSVNKSCAGVFRDVPAFEQWYGKVVVTPKTFQWMRTHHSRKVESRYIAKLLEGRNACLTKNFKC